MVTVQVVYHVTPAHGYLRPAVGVILDHTLDRDRADFLDRAVVDVVGGRDFKVILGVRDTDELGLALEGVG